MKSNLLPAIILSAIIGLAIGIGAYTFIYAKGGSYLTNDPAACANCHIMEEHYEGWIKSSHRSVATCNDCHTPDGFVSKYLTKASNGFWHSFGFTTGNFPDPLRIKPGNREITEQACRRCHGDIVEAIESGAHMSGATQQTGSSGIDEESEISCVRCHATVGHWVR
jgi:cytochrome c nitrite reductase small subunit